ncbi:glycosyltransferase family 2 protein [Adlercreutzia sp. ZJ304]|uniref:glycosyltransferase family 2 protein n=1 Tax=Adlercreutzia sp. ZJ304 TaxID=2709791 RepID=UPI001F150F43|nr:glycosyltransferase family 2 protein [Adlercreutzia sp. ZJ304]
MITDTSHNLSPSKSTQYKKEDVLVIIPAYNEQEAILSTVSKVMSAGYDCVVINDGSTDYTLDICRDVNIPVLNLSVNLGIGGAVQTGHRYAREHGYAVDIQFDGDGQHDVSSIPALVASIETGADLVVGSRFVDKSKSSFQSTGLRRAGIKWLSAVIKLMTGYKIMDVTSGFRACNTNAINLFCKHYPSDYPEPESIVEALKAGLEVAEVSATMHERQGGASSIKAFSSIYYMLKVTISVILQGLTRGK